MAVGQAAAAIVILSVVLLMTCTSGSTVGCKFRFMDNRHWRPAEVKHLYLEIGGNMLGRMKLWKILSATIFEHDGKKLNRRVGRQKRKNLSKLTCSLKKFLFIVTILLSNDISMNPGPIKNPCTSCLGPVAKNHKSVSCDLCSGWTHIRCEGITAKAYKVLMKLDGFNWVCRTCVTAQQPFYDIEDDELLEYIEHGNHQGTLRPLSTDINDMDISCITNRKGFKILHLNISGLLHKLDYVKMLADKIKFDVLSLNETKLDGSIGDEDIEIPGYTYNLQERQE